MERNYGLLEENNNNINHWDPFINMLSFEGPESPESDMEEESTGSTNELDDNSLLEIFSYLSMRDIMNAAKVCRKWRRLCEHSWTALENLQCIDYEWLLFGKLRGQKLHLKGTCPTYLEQILMKRGHGIKYFYLSHNHNLRLFIITSKFCRDLSTIEIRINAAVFNEFDTHMRNLLENNVNLQTFIYYNEFDDSVLKNIFLQYMSEYIENIILYVRYNVKPSFIISAIKKFKCLQSFECRAGCGIFFDSTILESMNCDKSLNSIFLNESKLASSMLLSQTVDLVNLTHLSLRGDKKLKDLNLMNVINNCKRLKYLDLTQCSRITDAGIISLAKLNDLDILEISYCDRVTDKSIIYLPPSMTTLICSHCLNITDCVINLIKNSLNLKVLDLSYCSIGNATIEAAIEVANKRIDNGLTIKVNNTCVDLSKISNIPPLLSII
ncbi:hypothetical protein PV328_010909 [Microctonus aethiopoides]|uniref:F-box domain-containing protein n=1 Tax=Microctonus aethiopoides TaxID=144406 RepID=A0AA39KQQ0_9HYME|nr:hypothetical protein PV328_010909 [Microctonus aethiopoides]